MHFRLTPVNKGYSRLKQKRVIFLETIKSNVYRIHIEYVANIYKM